jgi:transposase
MSKMQGKRKRRIHSREFKADTVQVVRTGGRTISEVARDLGLAESLVRSWVKQAEADDVSGGGGAVTTAEREELSRLRKEVKVLRMEREILKRAATFFAKENP